MEGSKLQGFIDTYPRYRVLQTNSTFIQIFEFLSEPESISHMSAACQNGRPALYGVIEKLEQLFEDQLTALSHGDSFNLFKQGIGSAVYFILYPYGFRYNKQRTLPHSKFFSTSMHYNHFPNEAELGRSSLNPNAKKLSENTVPDSNSSSTNCTEPGIIDPIDNLSDQDAIKIFETLCLTKDIGNAAFKNDLIKKIKRMLLQWV